MKSDDTATLREQAVEAWGHGREQAAIWLASAAAEQGDTAAMYTLAVMEDLRDDFETERMWLERAANGGHPLAQDGLPRLEQQGPEGHRFYSYEFEIAAESLLVVPGECADEDAYPEIDVYSFGVDGAVGGRLLSMGTDTWVILDTTDVSELDPRWNGSLSSVEASMSEAQAEGDSPRIMVVRSSWWVDTEIESVSDLTLDQVATRRRLDYAFVTADDEVDLVTNNVMMSAGRLQRFPRWAYVSGALDPLADLDDWEDDMSPDDDEG